MPNLLQTLRNTYATDKAAALNMLPELFRQYGEGLIKVLPCKEGTEIYRISENGKIQERYFSLTYNRPSDFGKTVFLTRTEAEKALKEHET